MSRAKRKRVNAMHRKQADRKVKRFVAAILSSPVQRLVNQMAYVMAQRFLQKKEDETDV